MTVTASIPHQQERHHPIVAMAPYENMTITLGGVKLHLEWEEEILYLEVCPFHSKKALTAALAAIDALGLELIPADECPPEVSDECTRVYLCESSPNGLSSMIALSWPSLL